MLWKQHFERGTALFKQGKFPEALEQFNQALANGGEKQYILYDSRAAVYTNLDKPKDALHDAKTTISLAPQRWHGYARAARLFMKTHKLDASLTMVDRALACIKPEDLTRHGELSKLRQEIANTQRVLAERAKAMRSYITQMPVEIYVEIFQMVLTDNYARIITLLQICAFWRQVIWEAPSLWHTLVLSKARPEKKASLWLERAGKRIRELHVLDSYCPIGKPSFLDDIDWSYLRVCRIHSLNIETYIDPRLMFSQLKDLEISAGRDNGGEYLFSLPELKSLSIHRAKFYSLTPRQSYTCLASLYLEKCTLDGDSHEPFFNSLVHNSQLELLHLDNCYLAPRNTVLHIWENDYPVFQSLKTLEMIATVGASQILQCSFPALQKLLLESFVDTRITAFLSSEFPSLTDISLKKVPLDQTTLDTILGSARTLETITLNGIYANPTINFLVKEDQPGGLPCLCPRLRYLDVSNCPDMQTSTLHALIQQRLRLSTIEGGTDDEAEGGSAATAATVNKLEVLKMNGCPEIDSRWLPWFREHVAEVSCIYNSSRGQKQRHSAKRINGI
ncbi:hypothetical protein AGABI2DRAFT_186458 [Agaricus bisporus var. bisporus H97]|uniref:hypothetical protein n=1 Tax=Agaricus bisporus var. bisporus (strain H97 / ATCC MYA-4626 / FGSC 10389) TaxID=936046 RepID=UPI00029F78D0|nr:hypothetical protein AGABI2DRAFT_186458 [Agaricus bisporus var. bisporus H97]EKV45749.1 hypothetical protein AGABI2DRAFT_186458 [Agaricus bisporus var. bisporus H97]